MNDIFNFFSPLSFVKSGTVAYNPLINYDWSTTTTSGLRYLKDVGSTPTYNASMYFGRGAYLNGVDQSITIPINTTIQTALKRVNGVVTINETSQVLTNYVISGLGVHKDYYLFTRLLTTSEKDSYTNTPELFYAMAQADSTCVLNMPMCETDGYARNMKSYSESSDMFTSFNNFTRGYQESGATYTISADGKSISNVYKRTDFNTNINLIAGNAYKISTDKPTSGTYYFTYFDNVYSSQLNFSVGTLSQSIFIPTASGVAKIRVWSDTTAFFNNNSIKQLTGTYAITNYTTSVRDNAKNLQYGLQTCKFVRDGLGVIQSASDYLECNGVGYGNTGWIVDTTKDFTVEFTKYVDHRSDVSDWIIQESGLYSKFRITTSKYSGGWLQVVVDNNLTQINISTMQGTFVSLVIVAVAGNNFKVYVNKVLKTTTTFVNTVVDTQGFRLGSGLTWSTNGVHRNFEKNPITKFKVHSKALTNEEIQAL